VILHGVTAVMDKPLRVIGRLSFSHSKRMLLSAWS